MNVNASLIREHRKKRGWSQEQLAIVSGLGLRTVHRIENEGSASLESLMALASAMSLDIEDLQGQDIRSTPNKTNRFRSLELLVRIAFAITAGLLVPLLLDLTVYGGLLDFNRNSWPIGDEILFSEFLCGMLFGAFVLFPFTSRNNKSKIRSLMLILSGAISFMAAIATLFYSMDYLYGETIESFLLSSMVGGSIVLIAAKVLLKLVIPLLYWLAALVLCLFGGAYMYLAILVLGDYEFLTLASIAGFCLWHGMLTWLLFNATSRGGSGPNRETVIEPLVQGLDDSIGESLETILMRQFKKSWAPRGSVRQLANQN